MEQELYIVAINLGDHTVPALVSYVDGRLSRRPLEAILEEARLLPVREVPAPAGA